jgi:hypothetical protein
LKKIFLIGIIITTVGLIAGFSIPAFAHDPGEAAAPVGDAWQAMHEACESGDWEAMAESAEEFHEQNGYGDCPGYGFSDGDADSTSGTNGMMGGGWGGHMGGNMMGW